jgi:hypothetical protein
MPRADDRLPTYTSFDLDYIEWVEKVAVAFAQLRKDHAQVGVQALRAELGVGIDPGSDDREFDIALWNAIEDLDAISVVNALNTFQILETENTRKIRAGTALSTVWPSFFTTFLDPEQSDFLSALVRLADVAHEDFADVQWATAAEVFEALGWSTSDRAAIGRAHAIVNVLEGSGLIRKRVAMGSLGAVRGRPTYRGVVFATQQVATEWQQRPAEMAAEWETTTVEYKREVKLGNPTQKGEFVKDILGLATTKASGRERYLIIGYDNETHAFAESVDTGIAQDRLEQILHQYTEPMPEVRYFTVPMSGGGEAGLIAVRRDPARVPYRARRDIGRIAAGSVFVRHGSQTEPPTGPELAALEAEGERARQAG